MSSLGESPENRITHIKGFRGRSYILLIVALVFMVEAQGNGRFGQKTDISAQYIFRGTCLFRNITRPKSL